MKKIYYLIIITAYLFQGCASKRPPTGGAKDISPPKVDTTYPGNYSINNKLKKLVIVFDEKINDNNLKQNLFITPYINNPYKVKIKNNKLILEFEKEFNTNTTYRLNFGASIEDKTEHNKTKNLQYIFSTGSFIDSLEIDIEGIFPLSSKPCIDCLVSIYSSSDTLNVHEDKPLYFGYTDKNGKAKIKNIKNSSYIIHILKDENKSYTYDKGESIAKSNDTIKLNINKDIGKLYMINNNHKKNKIIEQSVINNSHKLTFRKGIKKASIIDTNGRILNVLNSWFSDSYNINMTIKPIYNSPYLILAKDSMDIVDTLHVRFIKDTTIKYLKTFDRSLVISEGDSIKIELSNYIKTIDLSKIKITTDSVYKVLDNILIDSISNLLVIPLDESYYQNSSIKILIDSNAIESYEFTNKKTELKYTVLPITELGSISGRVNSTDDCILELLDQNFKVIRTLINPKEFSFNKLKPLTYKLRVKIDSNKNGRWDGGNVKNGIIPEDIIFHNEIIKLRKNWEIKDILINVTDKKTNNLN